MYQHVSVGFDGLHRSGKGTQISLFMDYLMDQGVYAVARRGDGTRRGRGLTPQDPKSQWWEDNNAALRAKPGAPREEILTNLLAINQRVDRELIVAERQCFRRLHGKRGLLLLDRTFVSRIFVMRQYNSNGPIADLMVSRHLKSGREMTAYVPSVTFILHAPMELLLERCSQDDDPDKRKFRSENIRRHYNLFEDTLRWLQESEYEGGLEIVDASASAETIHKDIVRRYLNRIR